MLASGGWPTVLAGGYISSGCDADGIIAVDSCTGGGRCARDLRCRASGVILCGGTRLLFLTMHDLSSFASLRMVRGSQVFVW